MRLELQISDLNWFKLQRPLLEVTQMPTNNKEEINVL